MLLHRLFCRKENLSDKTCTTAPDWVDMSSWLSVDHQKMGKRSHIILHTSISQVGKNWTSTTTSSFSKLGHDVEKGGEGYGLYGCITVKKKLFVFA